MPSLSVGFAQVEDRLRSVRRRLNLLIVQDAAYLAGTAVAAAVAALIGLAIWRKTLLPFGMAWLALAGLAVVAVPAALRMHRRWLSREAVIHFADRNAQLDDRLATLLLDPPRVRTSSLHVVLVEQILAAAPRWDVDVLAPRRVPRSLFLFAAALSALIVTTYFDRPPAIPASAMSVLHPHGSPETGSSTKPSATGRDGSGTGHGLGAFTTEPAGRSADLNGDAARIASGAATGLHNRPDGATAGSIGDDRSAEGSSGSADHRDGDGATPSAATTAARATDAERQSNARAADADAAGAPSDAPAADRARGSAPSTDQGAGLRREGTGDTSAAPNAPGNQPTGRIGNRPGNGSAAAEARAGETGGLFSTQASKDAPNGSPHPLPVALGAVSSSTTAHLDPQRPDPAHAALAQAGAPHAPQPMTDEQMPDAPLQKADIAPEHESLIRRIFTPDE